jgi:hypothetical protein
MSIASIKEKYTKTLNEFLNKWEKVVPRKLLLSMENLYLWVKNYDQQTNKRVYLRKGIDILNNFIKESEIETDKIRFAEIQCRTQLLKGSNCTMEKAELLKSLSIDYNHLIRDLIGCKDRGMNLLLQLIENSNIDPKYTMDLTNKCYELATENIKYY